MDYFHIFATDINIFTLDIIKDLTQHLYSDNIKIETIKNISKKYILADKVQMNTVLITDRENNVVAICRKNEVWKYVRPGYEISDGVNRKSCISLIENMKGKINVDAPTMVAGIQCGMVIGKGYTSMCPVTHVWMRVDNYEHFKKHSGMVDKCFYKPLSREELEEEKKKIRGLNAIDFINNIETFPEEKLDTCQWVIIKNDDIMRAACARKCAYLYCHPSDIVLGINASDYRYLLDDHIMHIPYKVNQMITTVCTTLNHEYMFDDKSEEISLTDISSVDKSRAVVFMNRIMYNYIKKHPDQLLSYMYNVETEPTEIPLLKRLGKCSHGLQDDTDSLIAVLFREDTNEIASVCENNNELWKCLEGGMKFTAAVSKRSFEKEFGDLSKFPTSTPILMSRRIILNRELALYERDVELYIDDLEPPLYVVEVNDSIYNWIQNDNADGSSRYLSPGSYRELEPQEYQDNIHPIQMYMNHNYPEKCKHGKKGRRELVKLEYFAEDFINFASETIKYTHEYVESLLVKYFPDRILTLSGEKYIHYEDYHPLHMC